MDLMDYRRKIIMSSPHLSHAEGAVASFADGTDLPLKSLIVDIEPVQSGSGDPSPTNVRPISGWSAANVTVTGNQWQIEEGSTATPYEPYTGTSVTIDLGRTIYGGTLNVLTGELVVDRYFVDPSQWTQYKANNGYKAYQIQNIPNGRYRTDAMNMPLSNMIAEFGGFSSSAMSKNIIQPPRSNTNVAYMALQDGIDPTTVELSYLMLTPITYQLDPQTVRSLVGQNNIFADTGNVALEYWALVIVPIGD